MRLRIFIGFLILAGCFMSCTIEKRHYRNGFYVDLGKEKKHSVLLREESPVAGILPVINKIAAPVPGNDSAVAEKSNSPDQQVRRRIHKAISPVRFFPSRDTVKPLPPRKVKPALSPSADDKPNKLLLTLFLIALFLPITTYFALLIPFVPLWLTLGLIILALLIYISAILIRNRFEKKFPHSTEEKFRLSPSWSYFRHKMLIHFIFLALLITGILMVTVADFTIGTLAGLVAVLFETAGIFGGIVMLLILGILAILYLVRRKRARK
jgi:hypothetical protein